MRVKSYDYMKQYDKTEDMIKSLESTGQIVGEVLKRFDDEKYIIKASSGPRYLVGVRPKLDRAKLIPGNYFYFHKN